MLPSGLIVLNGRDATVSAVHAAMPGHRWIPLSCHGQDLRDPSAAGLEPSDGTLTVTRLSGARYAGDLAFLSACRAAVGGVDLPDEVITLAAALDYTGCPACPGNLAAGGPGRGRGRHNGRLPGDDRRRQLRAGQVCGRPCTRR